MKCKRKIEEWEDKKYNGVMFEEHFAAQFPVTTRKEEIDNLVSFVRNGTSCQLVGIPGANRSTVLGLLVYNKSIREHHLGIFQDTSHFVLVDFSEVRNRPLFDVMKYLFLNLTESLRERGLKEENQAVGDIFREHLKFQDEFFLFDRFEEYIPTVTADFFANLRILRNRGRYRFSVVFSVNRPLEDMLDPDLLADYYEFVAGKIVPMKLNDKPSTDFWIENISKLTKRKLDPSLIQKVVKLTGGHGKLTKLSVEALITQKEMPTDAQKFLLAQKIIRKSLQEIWHVFSPAEQADLLEGKFEDSSIAEYLEQVGVIKNSQIQIPLLAAFLAQEYKDVAKTLQKISYDEHTNTIRKGTTVLSDQLTSAEFRLLRYLLQNEERVIEREELITVVWGDNKSIAGITDQEVDQLIFRLRRKIEEDANHPAHLQTVKGRGFTFTS